MTAIRKGYMGDRRCFDPMSGRSGYPRAARSTSPTAPSRHPGRRQIPLCNPIESACERDLDSKSEFLNRSRPVTYQTGLCEFYEDAPVWWQHHPDCEVIS